jgi:SAM-dependent methyltransferase
MATASSTRHNSKSSRGGVPSVALAGTGQICECAGFGDISGGAFDAMWERLTGAFRRHGAGGALGLIPKNAWNAISYFAPRRLRVRRSLAEFDRRFGVDTAGSRSVGRLHLPAEISSHAAQYQTVLRVDTYLSALAIAFAQYTFVDYGCGKGRALLMASEYPFKQIIGVECSPQLVAVARRNLASYRSATQRCRAISVVASDAGVFHPPDTPAVFFFYNPFDAVILEKVLARIRRANAAERPPDYLIYVDPQHRSCIEATGEWEIAADRRNWVLYRAGAAGGDPATIGSRRH